MTPLVHEVEEEFTRLVWELISEDDPRLSDEWFEFTEEEEEWIDTRLQAWLAQQ